MRMKCGLLIIVGMILNCSHFKPQIQVGGFNFDYRGKIGRIEGVTPNYQEGYNVLTLRDDGKLILKAIDSDQDGTLNEVLAGSMTLAEAEKVYQTGLDYGFEKGLIHQRTLIREFEWKDARTVYRLASLVLLQGETYNRFTIVPPSFEGPVTICIDENADGKLDRIEQGNGVASDYQELYRLILDKGMHAGKIKQSRGKFIISL